MHLQQVSEIFFDETIAMPARTSGAGAVAAQKFLPLLEPLCRREMERCLEAGEAVATALEARIEVGGAAAGDRLRLGGWVEQISDRSATFRVRAHAADGVVFEAALRFHVVAADAVPTLSPRPATPAPRSAVTRREFAVAAG